MFVSNDAIRIKREKWSNAAHYEPRLMVENDLPIGN